MFSFSKCFCTSSLITGRFFTHKIEDIAVGNNYTVFEKISKVIYHFISIFAFKKQHPVPPSNFILTKQKFRKAPDTTTSTDLVTKQEYKHASPPLPRSLVTFRRSYTINTLFGFNCEPRVPWGLRSVTYLQAASEIASSSSNLTLSSSPSPFALLYIAFVTRLAMTTAHILCQGC